MTAVRLTDVLVIGAGQAGLSAAHHLGLRGIDRIVVDAEDGPGGAWRHRWDSLTMATVNGIFDLPGMPREDVDPATPSNVAIPDYFARFEAAHVPDVERPVRVRRVRRVDGGFASELEFPAISGAGPDAASGAGPDAGGNTIFSRALVNATGTWRRPFVPSIPGHESFRGRHVRTVDYGDAEDFRGHRVAVVGGGISAAGFLLEVDRVAEVLWFIRRPPVLRRERFTPEIGADVVARVDDRVRRGLRPQSVVSLTGLPYSPELAAHRALPMFTAIEPEGVRLRDGSFESLDDIIWATGFRADLGHLAPLKLRGPGGGIRMDGTAVAADPRIHLAGYGPGASTVGANRAGRDVAIALKALFDD